MHVRCILTAAAQHFVTPLAAGALAGERAYTDLFDPRSEFDVGHIRLARDTDLVVVAPATADLIAKMAGGHADDLASAVLLATDKPILIAPAMNPHMWAAKATQRNLAQLAADGIRVVGPNAGEMAERGEAGFGRMAEPLEIAAAAEALLRRSGRARRQARAGHLRSDQRADRSGALYRQSLVGQAGPRHRRGRRRGRRRRGAGERPGQPARSAAALPSSRSKPRGKCSTRSRRRCRPMSPYSPPPLPIGAPSEPSASKIKKQQGRTPTLKLIENPDILSTIAHRKSGRPQLVIGFAAETDHVIANAKAKLAKKGCDWILANDVSPATGIMGGDSNTIHLITAAGVEVLAAAVEG